MENKDIILSNFIENNLEKLGLEESENEEVLHYLLKRNIKSIFGKNNFTPYEIEINSIVEQELNCSKKRKCSLQILCGNTQYIVNSCFEGHSLEMKVSNSPIGLGLR